MNKPRTESTPDRPPAMSVQGHSPLSSCNLYHISPAGNAAVFSDIGMPGKIGIGLQISQNCEFFFAKYVYFYFTNLQEPSQEDFFFFLFYCFLLSYTVFFTPLHSIPLPFYPFP